MALRCERDSNIGIKSNVDGVISVIYCHSDGYLEHVGRTLIDHYTDPIKIKCLMELGDLSSLGKNIGKKIDFDSDHNSEFCKAYGRDRGESNTGCTTHLTELEYIGSTDNTWAEYLYLFKDNAWYYSKGKDFNLLQESSFEEENDEDDEE